MLVFGLVILLTGLAYVQTLRNEFVYDDRVLVAQNKLFQRLDAIPQLFVTDWWRGVSDELGRVPTQGDGPPATGDRRYRPLAAVTYVLNHVLGGPAPWGYHLVNVLLHAGVSYLLYLVAARLGWSAAAAAVAAVLFAVHPLHTEAVAWVVGRPELLMALGVLGGVWCELRGARRSALVAFGLALLSKEQAVVLPGLLVLIDLCRGDIFAPERGWRQWLGMALRRYAGYGVVLAVYLTLRTMVMGGFQPPAFPFLENPLEYTEGLAWGLSVVKLAGRYLWLSLWPVTLSADYSYNAIPMAKGLGEAGVLWGLGAWGGLLALGVWGWRQDRRLTLAVGLTVVTFAPVANVLISVGTPLAERLFYLPLGGLCLLAGLAYERGTRAAEFGTMNSKTRPERVGSLIAQHPSISIHVLVALVCLALTVRTIMRVQDWHSQETLFRSVIQVFSDNAKAHAVLGDELMSRKDAESLKQALVEYRKALDSYPDYMTTHAGLATNFGSVLLDLGYPGEALEAMKLAVELSPEWSRTHYNLGLVYARLKEYAQAEVEWNRALALRPEDPQIRSSLSRLFLERGRYIDGLEAAEAALAIDPQFVPAIFNRALALEALGRLPEAVHGFEQVLSVQQAPVAARQDAERRLVDIQTKLNPKQVPERRCMPGVVACR